MKRIFAAALAALLSFSTFAATLVPIQLLNPTGSTSGQVPVSTGSTSAPAWGNVSISTLTGVLPIVSGGTGQTTAAAALTALGGLSTTTAASTYATITSLALKAPLASPTFTGTVTASGATLVGFPGRLLNVRVFTASGTYTPTTGTAAVYVKVQAGGGAGGGTPATSTGQYAAGSGGGAGSYGEGYYTTGFSGVTITIGGSASGVSGANGTVGNTSSFGSLISCAGGTGGLVGVLATTGPLATPGGVNASACTGTILFGETGTAGDQSMIISAATLVSGRGAASVFGPGAPMSWVAGAGNGTSKYGAGGAGANAVVSTAAQAGGISGPGIVEVFEFSQ